MALSATSFSSASMVAKVKMAMQQATYDGLSVVHDRKGNEVMRVGYIPGCTQPFQFFNEGQGDVSALVVAGARRFHEGLRNA